MAQISIRFKAVILDIDTAAKVINGLHVEYDLTAAGATTPRVFDSVPSTSSSADLWALLARYLRPLAAGAGVVPPDPPLPGNPG